MLVNELVSYIDKLLSSSDFDDCSYNGLQVAGIDEINKIVCGVTICQELIEQAIAVSADTILVHHGLFWRGDDPHIVGIKQQRIKLLLEHGINLLAYHLPLDFHAEYGNNVQFAKELNIKIDEQNPPLYFGKLAKPLSSDEMINYLTVQLKQKPVFIFGGSDTMQSVAWCVGKAPDFIEQAKAKGIDAYITGEISESSVYLARELGINLFAAGHYATERYGVKALTKHLTEKFQITTKFIELTNMNLKHAKTLS